MSKDLIQVLVLVVVAIVVGLFVLWFKYQAKLDRAREAQEAHKQAERLRQALLEEEEDHANMVRACQDGADIAVTVGRALGRVINDVGTESEKFFAERDKKSK